MKRGGTTVISRPLGVISTPGGRFYFTHGCIIADEIF